LKKLADNTIGIEDDLLLFQIESHINLLRNLNNTIDKYDQLITNEFLKRKSFIHTIPGIGIISAATILAEINNIYNFNHHGKMVKRGSSLLRQTIMNSAQYSLIHNHKFYDYYNKKRDEGKPHRVALSHVAKKLIRMIYTLETKQIAFDINQMK